MMNLDEMLPEQDESTPEFEDNQEEYCLYCGQDLSDSPLYRLYGVCHKCRFHHSVPAWHRIALIADEGSFRETNRFLTSIDPLSFSGKQTYGERIQEAQARTGLTEAVITGVCTIGGNPTALAVLDFGFMGGNMGGVVGEKIAL
ncbi:MAG: acetyl-CoA carboxylase carboxyl transferase subunit beta, partial [Dehalococcoidia bacterium]|nr:acetyl-CoA carboxylase carboxyl transferase subunit beta [Dehalococcoidia bacterium]